MHGADGFRMLLPAGTYDFYAVSDNPPFSAPAFTDGKSEPLFNGIDYLWWGGADLEISTAQAGVPIVFQHRAAQVVFELTAGVGTTISELSPAHNYPPLGGAGMDLSTGVIPPAAACDTEISKMGVSGQVAQYILLPIEGDRP